MAKPGSMALKVFFDLKVDDEPFGRLVFRVSVRIPLLLLSCVCVTRCYSRRACGRGLYYILSSFLQLRPDVVPITSGEYESLISLTVHDDSNKLFNLKT